MSESRFASKNKVLLGGVIILSILVFVIAGIFIGRSVTSSPSYYAVYLNTGDLYFGKLSRIPNLSLSDVWYLGKSAKNNGKLSLNKFSNAVWGPSNKMEINKDKVVWMVKLRKNSRIISVLNESASQQDQAHAVQNSNIKTNSKGIKSNTSK